MDEFNYERIEIDRALKGHPERHKLSLKITGDENATRWLSVSPAQVRAIRELLADGDLNAARAALTGEIG
jgi:hypothetical protein